MARTNTNINNISKSNKNKISYDSVNRMIHDIKVERAQTDLQKSNKRIGIVNNATVTSTSTPAATTTSQPAKSKSNKSR
jgi:hypothetical protein